MQWGTCVARHVLGARRERVGNAQRVGNAREVRATRGGGPSTLCVSTCFFCWQTRTDNRQIRRRTAAEYSRLAGAEAHHRKFMGELHTDAREKRAARGENATKLSALDADVLALIVASLAVDHDAHRAILCLRRCCRCLRAAVDAHVRCSGEDGYEALMSHLLIRRTGATAERAPADRLLQYVISTMRGTAPSLSTPPYKCARCLSPTWAVGGCTRETCVRPPFTCRRCKRPSWVASGQCARHTCIRARGAFHVLFGPATAVVVAVALSSVVPPHACAHRVGHRALW